MTNELFDNLTLGVFHSRFFAFCKAVGISRVNLEYSGGGDSGGVDNVQIVPSDPDKVLPEDIVSYIRNDLEEELSNPIYNVHGSFADGGGYSVNGTVVYNAVEKKAWIEGTHHYYEYNDEGEETDSNDEDWDEPVYEYDAEDSDGSRQFDFLIAYARLTNTQLPPVILNHLSAAAIAGDEEAQEYLGCLKK